MGKTFSKFSPRKISPAPTDPSDANEAPPEHSLDGELPFSAEEARGLLERVRETEEKDIKITSLKHEVESLRKQMNHRNEALERLIKELSALSDILKNNALEKILLGTDDIIRKAISDKIPELIEERIREIQTDMVESTFYASQETCNALKLSIISPDEQIPVNIVKCVALDGSEFIIEVNPA